jgi:hypothetical protein
MMTEQEEREQIKAKIIEDIDYLKKNENEIRTALVRIFPNSQDTMSVDIALNTLKMNDISYLDTGTLETLKTFYTNVINQFTIVARAFLSDISNKNAQNKLIESAKGFNDFINSISIKNKSEDTNFVLKADGGRGLSLELNKIYQRIKTLEQEQKPLNEIVIRNEQYEKAYSNEINEIKESIADLQSTEVQDNIQKILAKTLSLYDEAKNSSGLVNQEIQELKKAKEGHIAYNLSKELQHKSDDLKKEYEKKVGSLSWKPWEFKGFYGAIAILLLINLISWVIYFTAKLEIEFWHFMMLKLTINIPLIIYVAFALNEYTKAKKLYEEFDYKRILAQTLMNNYNQFKTDFTDDKDKLLDLIKAPLEKIFDNPVHSIYGDKSGDKNIGLDQLEKITSIIEKMKK